MSDTTVLSHLPSHITLFHHVAEYAVDNMGYRHNPLAEEVLDLNPETFYAKLYVTRPTVEQELYEAILTSAQNICIRGRCGAGKTSLVGSVLRKLEPSQQGLILRFDFKAISEKQEIRAIERAHGDSEDMTDRLSRFVDNLVMAKLEEFVTTRSDLTWDGLMVELVRDGRSTYEEDLNTVEARVDLTHPIRT